MVSPSEGLQSVEGRIPSLPGKNESPPPARLFAPRGNNTEAAKRFNPLARLPQEGLRILAEAGKKIFVDGFENVGQACWAVRALKSIGLPLLKVREFIYSPNTPRDRNLVGSMSFDGVMRLYKKLETLPPIAQLATMVHELTHANCPFKKEAPWEQEARRKAQEYALRIAQQTFLTGKYMNGYHHELTARVRLDKISMERYLTEVLAIVAEQRFTNPKHLAQVENAQLKRIDTLVGDPARLAQVMNSNAKVFSQLEAVAQEYGINGSALQRNVSLTGVGDHIFTSLIPGVDSSEALNRHIQRVVGNFPKEVTPLTDPMFRQEGILFRGRTDYALSFLPFSQLLINGFIATRSRHTAIAA